MLYLRHRMRFFDDGGIDIRRTDRMLRDLSARVGQVELRNLTKKRAFDLGEMGKENGMRKYLVGVAAAAAGVALAMPATAQDDMDMEHAHMSIGGSFTQDFGFGSWTGGEESADDLHMDIGATLTFTGTGTTDGGLTATAVVKLDADNGEIDESYLTIAGGFGEINVGSDDNASNMHGNKGTGTGYGGLGYYDTSSYTPASIGGPPNGGGDALGIRYSTPSIGGFQAGISFQPETDAVRATTAANDSNMIAVGVNFSGDFAGTSVTFGAGHVSLNPGGDGDTLKEWGLGTSIGIGDTTLSLRYDTKPDANEHALTGAASDTSSYGIGIDHKIGALNFGIGYGSTKVESVVLDGVKTQTHLDAASLVTFNAALKDDRPYPRTTAALGDPDPRSLVSGDRRKALDQSSRMIHLGATYDLGGGVKISAGISSGKMTNSQINGDPSAVYVCPDNGEGEAQTNVGNTCYEAAEIADGYYMKPGQNNEPAVVTGTDDDETIPTGGTVTSHSYSYAVKDLDDVGVGLRIAFSF